MHQSHKMPRQHEWSTGAGASSEMYAAMLRFAQWDKVTDYVCGAELPIDLMEIGRDDFV
jgi:hypothetical protein